MLKLTVEIEGKVVEVKSREQLLTFYKFLSSYLKFTTATEELAAAESRRKDEPAKTSRERYKSPNSKSTADWITEILQRNPRGLTYIQVTNILANEGWVTQSKDPSNMARSVLTRFPNRFVSRKGKWFVKLQVVPDDAIPPEA